MADLEKMTDRELAERHAGYKPDTVPYLLCSFEWQRRAQMHAFKLAEKISVRERRATLVSAGLGAIAAVAVVFLALWLMPPP